MLDKTFMLPGRLHQQLSFMGIMGAGLLHVNMLASRTPENGSRGMPVVAGRNDEDIDIRPVEDAPEISHRLNLGAKTSGCRVRALLVDITYHGHLHIR